jgi:hypothetical protein
MGFNPQQPYNDLPALPSPTGSHHSVRRKLRRNADRSSTKHSSTFPNTAAFGPCLLNMSNAWRYPAPWVHFLEKFGHVRRSRHRCGLRSLGISSLRGLGTSNSSKTSNFSPGREPVGVRSHSYSKPGVPLSHDTHTSSGLSFYGDEVGECHKYFLDRIVPQSSWIERLMELLGSHIRMPLRIYGFRSDCRKCSNGSIKTNQWAGT